MSRTLSVAWVVLFVTSMAGSNASAQAPSPMLSGASQAKDLDFPSEPSAISAFATPRMALYKPTGAGPFPALVLHHHNFSKTDSRGTQVTYHYNKTFTQDSARRMFEFLDKTLGQ